MTAVREPQAGRDPDIAQPAEPWWAAALRGAFAAALGIVAVIWPFATLLMLVLLFSGYCIVDGVFSIVLALRGAKRRERRWWPALYALVALAAAALAVLYPEMDMLAFVDLLIAWALLSGAFAFAAAVRLGRAQGRGWLIAGAAVSLSLAALLVAWPGIGLLALAWMLAFYALTAGVTFVALALRLRLREAEPGELEAGKSQWGPFPRASATAMRDDRQGAVPPPG